MAVHLVPKSIDFSLFTANEIKKLCVLKIVTPLMLDVMGHPVPGGLYDHRLGPLTDKGEPCGTCNKLMMHCPGHFGYIELPLPLGNPLFHKDVRSILSVTCMACHKVQIAPLLKHCLIIQLKLLHAGLTTLAMDMEDIIVRLLQNKDRADETRQLIAPLEYVADQTNSTVGSRASQAQLKDVVSKAVTVGKVCMFCKKPIHKLQVFKTKIVMTKSAKGDVQEHDVLNSKYLLNPEESRTHMRQIWTEEKELLRQWKAVLRGIDAEYPTDVFYFELIAVPPPNVRPVNIVLDRVVEHAQSQTYKKILEDVILLRTIIQVQQKGDETGLTSSEAKAAYSSVKGDTAIEKVNYVWDDLQNDVNGLVDKESMRSKEGRGLKQIIEKKEGIVRMHMMGKRVNFSARSVITPDPNLNIDEIGVPEEFAKRLTYPVAVTPWNVEELRKMILNGPNVHPGAVMVEYDGSVKKINPRNVTQQKSILKCLMTPDDRRKGLQGVKIVHRHLCNGDVLLLNRQPTLHKPSIMAHTARILKGEKTLRLHYANCKAYNADFDGDEMNAHFPQNEIARSEGYNIVNVSNQYLVPKDGTPLSGLIQDHMISGVRLSLRGRFFSKDDYQQLVYQALAFKTEDIQLLGPAIVKPQRLWSGKQVVSTVIINIIPKGKARINLTATSKIPAKAWQTHKARRWKAGGTPFASDNAMSEAEVVIRGGELLSGILDKTHYGATPYGLVHCVYELYGGAYAIRMLSSLAKLFMRFLQQEGFTLGVHDILTVAEADARRKQIIVESRTIGVEVVTTALNIPRDTPIDDIVKAIEEASVTDPKMRAVIDRQYKSALDSYTNDINRTCLPAGLVCKFPHNNLQLMVESGAKGSTVNTMQISCLLGQIELEGKRPPVMISGKSLPSFPAFEFTPRAGGFIDGRFMTGIQPQEFFFHCMAGREGLIDTAVKTSRSGYLQRCLIKHLEGLHVAYDMTVRNSDGSVVQFLYGEDGLDISKAQFFSDKQLRFLSENTEALAQPDVLKQLKHDSDHKAIKRHSKKIVEWRSRHGDPLKKRRCSPFALYSAMRRHRGLSKDEVVHSWSNIDEETEDGLKEQCEACPDPLDATFQPDSHFRVLSEQLDALLNDNDCAKSHKTFRDLLKLKAMQSMCAPGEPVGLLAAQSIGEPSTQMTLNTFHFAGRGDMNVTLGIPRLREILMMASKNIKTPSMEIPFLDVPGLDAKAEMLRKRLTRVVVADVLERIDVSVQLRLQPVREHRYTLRFSFLPKTCYSNDYCVKPEGVLRHIKNSFFSQMFTAIRKYSKIKSGMVMVVDESKQGGKGRRGEDDEQAEEAEPELADGEASGSDDEPEDDEDAKAGNKFQETHEADEDVEDETNVEEEQEEDEAPADDEEESVVGSYAFMQNYVEDKQKHLWCEVTFALPLSIKKLDLTTLLKDVANKSVVWETPQIRRAITYTKDDKLMLRTDGINVGELVKYRKLLDLNKLYCNDIHKMAQTYGIEAASKIIVKEVKDVFNVYGIKVDPRHLSLIADYMTSSGTFQPLSRTGMESGASPLQQISFESSLEFLRNATVQGRRDTLENPSSCLSVGQPCRTGTGCFSVMHKLPKLGVFT